MEVFIVVGGLLALLGFAFLLNIRNVGVRYLAWYRENWAWTRGSPSLRTPRATRVVARATGLLWLCAGVFGILVGLNGT
jgi:hypothetical protein